jgi:hypothetical protein
MKKNTLAWFVIAGAGIALSGVGMAACSSSSATGTPTNPTDASSNPDSTQGGGDSGPVGDSGPTGDAGADSSCGSTPTLHTTTNDAGLSDIFCSPATGAANYCQIEAGTLNHCCINTSGTGFPDGECTTGACAAGDLDIQCLDDKGCGAGLKCCGLGHPYEFATCGYEKAFGFKGMQCAADCASIDPADAGHFEACSKSTGCSNGAATCIPTKEYIQFGACSAD